MYFYFIFPLQLFSHKTKNNYTIFFIKFICLLFFIRVLRLNLDLNLKENRKKVKWSYFGTFISYYPTMRVRRTQRNKQENCEVEENFFSPNYLNFKQHNINFLNETEIVLDEKSKVTG